MKESERRYRWFSGRKKNGNTFIIGISRTEPINKRIIMRWMFHQPIPKYHIEHYKSQLKEKFDKIMNVVEKLEDGEMVIVDNKNVSPESLRGMMRSMGIKDTGRTCGAEYSEIIELDNPETGNITLHPGEKRICAEPIYFSANLNRDLTCGACAIRETDCVIFFSRVLWDKMYPNSKELETKIRHAHQRLVYSGLEKKSESIMEQARKLHEYNLKKSGQVPKN